MEVTGLVVYIGLTVLVEFIDACGTGDAADSVDKAGKTGVASDSSGVGKGWCFTGRGGRTGGPSGDGRPSGSGGTATRGTSTQVNILHL